MGQSLIVVSSTTALFTMSFPVRTELYLLVQSPPWIPLGSMLLQTSPKAQQLPLHMSNSTILEFPIFMAIFKGDTSEFGGLGEHFIVLRTYFKILTSVEYTAEWIIDTWLKIEFTLIFISFSVKQSISSRFPYLTAYMKGFQLLGVVNQLIRCGKVLKKLITCFVSPCSTYVNLRTNPAEQFISIGMLRYVTVIGDFLFDVFSVIETTLIFVTFSFRKHQQLWRQTYYYTIRLDIFMMMKLVHRSLQRFSLDFSKLSSAITSSGIKNYTVDGDRSVEGYATKNFGSKDALHTVIMIHQWWGLNKAVTSTAEIFANKNIRVFVPDLYRGEAANSAQEAGHKMSDLNWPQALEDLKKVKTHLENKNSKSVSVVGFCMGGALTLAALSSITGWKAGGIFYGLPDLNVFRLDKITTRTIAHFGSEDPLKGFSDRNSALKLKQDCKFHNYPIEVRIYEGANHAFCNQDGNYFDSAARDEAFRLTRALIEA